MFPGVYGFTWQPGHLIFLGIFFSVVIVIASTTSIALLRTIKKYRADQREELCWQIDFHDLPADDRVCRHVYSGELKDRICDNSFDCASCSMHARLSPTGEPMSSRFYHRGHTWMEPQSDGTVLVGLDELGARLLGSPDEMELPSLGQRIRQNGTAWRMRKGRLEVRVLSPVDGEVVGTSVSAAPWHLRIKPSSTVLPVAHLMNETEANAWNLREMERLQARLTPELGPALADGGEIVNDLVGAYPERNWSEACGRVFLQP